MGGGGGGEKELQCQVLISHVKSPVKIEERSCFKFHKQRLQMYKKLGINRARALECSS